MRKCSSSDREPLIVTDGGRPVMALVPLDEDMDLETLSLSFNEEFIGIIERSRARQEAEGGIPIEEVRRQLGLD
ncbi:MAG: hypothetical protein F6K40_02545 [Okeania sp. SIO3I5]|uniref:hypothetical protein n=1 Tax=Okeania sp. SIO3I5 TaxID=2607805 RepID=UPI0013B735BC|nr:hypothetical protein [Okeania sp. SIO3I5]NEQ35245.1 hypothetical protein [Okeania sp. SIO3I5]